MKPLMQFWFWMSAILLVSFVGMVLGVYTNFNAAVVGVGMAVIGIAVVRKRLPSFLLEYSFACSALLIGGVITHQNLFDAGRWTSESISELLVMTSLQSLEAHVLETEEDKILAKDNPFEVGLKLFEHELPYKLLVAFNYFGLVLLDGDDITHLTDPRLYLITNHLPDGSILYYNKTVSQPFQTLMRAKLDGKKLHTIWEKPLMRYYLHHWGDEFEGMHYQPARLFQKLPNDLSSQVGHEYQFCNTENAFFDRIHRFSWETGEYVDSVELLNIIAQHEDLDEIRRYMTDCDDPLHLNNVQIIKNAKHAGYFPDGKVGDMLISMRDVHTVMLLDKDTHQPKWFVTGGDNGKFKNQHSPRITERGTILLFDNRGSNNKNGATRIVEIDIDTRELVGFYEATGREFFYSHIGGMVEILDNLLLVGDATGNKRVPYDKVSIFTLDCPNDVVSMDCERNNILKGEHWHHLNRIIPIKK